MSQFNFKVKVASWVNLETNNYQQSKTKSQADVKKYEQQTISFVMDTDSSRQNPPNTSKIIS